jgi:phytoene dehydrogenase-like protein
MIVETATFGMIATWALPVLACLVAFVTTINSVRRIRPDRQQRLVARAILGTWAVVALLLPIVLLGALGVLPRWTYGSAAALMLFASAVGGWIVMRRSTHMPGWR